MDIHPAGEDVGAARIDHLVRISHVEPDRHDLPIVDADIGPRRAAAVTTVPPRTARSIVPPCLHATTIPGIVRPAVAQRQGIP
ncbi:MAG: hypothetical protein U0531_20415 [Dehalococcoidia bacterium]